MDYASTLIERVSTKDHGRDFDVEVVVPGYGSVHRRVTWRRAVDETLTLDPVPVRIGLEEFSGDPSIGARLGGRLAAAHPRFKITDAAALATLREELRKHDAAIDARPMVQMPMRALGIDFIVSGRVDAR